MALVRATLAVLATVLAMPAAAGGGFMPVGPEYHLARARTPGARLDVAIGDATALATAAGDAPLPMRVRITEPLIGALRAGEEIARIDADFGLRGGRCIVFRGVEGEVAVSLADVPDEAAAVVIAAARSILASGVEPEDDALLPRLRALFCAGTLDERAAWLTIFDGWLQRLKVFEGTDARGARERLAQLTWVEAIERKPWDHSSTTIGYLAISHLKDAEPALVTTDIAIDALLTGQMTWVALKVLLHAPPEDRARIVATAREGLLDASDEAALERHGACVDLLRKLEAEEALDAIRACTRHDHGPCSPTFAADAIEAIEEAVANRRR
jgi:hypothetical protein